MIAITDGDTIKARCGQPGEFEQITVRVAEIDAPEKRQPFGEASRQALAALCFNQTAQIKPQTKDRYGRMVARVECQGKDASTELIRVSMAWVFDRYVKDKGLYALQNEARAERRGLWREDGAVAPWEWRRMPGQ